MSRILVAYASSLGQTHKVADAIAAELRRCGHEVELASLLHGVPPPVEDYDAIILGSRVRYNKHAQEVIDYILANRAEIEDIPAYFFSVSMAAASGGSDPQGYLEQLFTVTHWRPREAIAIAGNLAYRQYGLFMRWAMKRISRKTGHTTDTSRNHEFTNWTQVRSFAARIATDLTEATTALLEPQFFAAVPRKASASEPVTDGKR